MHSQPPARIISLTSTPHQSHPSRHSSAQIVQNPKSACILSLTPPSYSRIFHPANSTVDIHTNPWWKSLPRNYYGSTISNFTYRLMSHRNLRSIPHAASKAHWAYPQRMQLLLPPQQLQRNFIYSSLEPVWAIDECDRLQTHDYSSRPGSASFCRASRNLNSHR